MRGFSWKFSFRVFIIVQPKTPLKGELQSLKLKALGAPESTPEVVTSEGPAKNLELRGYAFSDKSLRHVVNPRKLERGFRRIGARIPYTLKGMRILMLQLSGFYCRTKP